MEVILAGFNLDAEIIEGLKNGRQSMPVTPETLSAAYARISRYPARVTELRRKAREEVEKARKSNRTIIFEMGHHSVAEHAVFNFDVIGISRLAVEALQSFRLASYTEKSQRYITLKDDFVLPEEISKMDIQDEFIDLIKAENSLYHSLFKELKAFHAGENPVLAQNKRDLANRAKEDARYVASLSTQSQMGMTVNARELELMIRRFASHPLEEVRQLGGKLYEEARIIAPSLLLFCKSNPYDAKTYPALADYASKLEFEKTRQAQVELIRSTEEADHRLLAALLHRVSASSYEACMKAVEDMNSDQRLELVKIAFERAELYDAMLPEFEHLRLTFEIVCSASCFAQLKRHRMATITPQPYDPGLGFAIPQSIKDIGRLDDYKHTMEHSLTLYHRIAKHSQVTAPYALTNAHRRRVLVSLDARELYHFSRLRSDAHAQAEIRDVSDQMVHLSRMVMPLTMMLAGGKDAYAEMYGHLFGHPPRVVDAELPGEREIDT
ncbi:thymidylate synthase (FAD) [candidate division WOR-3 bacterium]|uniref:Thymidylate synthase (FAD) n=1 Tax=candidate division WOR-3 bacterium TaxID=2052148 RepID=A0A9D5QC59_UNCW3|nr:thymidylate synthase (FAD) [candidate division WOR-3 bacterium]MBD3364184.1 thymidylate synthase (FAD) [candidate division WOR-3 bacterium]